MFDFAMFSSRNFQEVFYSYSAAMIPGNERSDVDKGGKIIMPPSSLEWLSRLNVSYPMLFKLTNEKMKRITHSGVLEFIADEGKVYLPNWMMRNLMLEEGDRLEVEYTMLPVATFSRFQPQSEDFLDIHNPKAVLENSLRQFACLTTGDIINIRYNERNYELSVLETEPGDAVSIIECDMNVDFAPPVGYKEDVVKGNDEDVQGEEFAEENANTTFVPFVGEGYRLDGKKKKSTDSDMMKPKRSFVKRGIPDYDWKIGTLHFMRNLKQPAPAVVGNDGSSFQSFGGIGHTLGNNNEDQS